MINDQLQTQLKINTTLLEAFNKLLVTGNASIPDFVISLGNSLSITNAIAQNNVERLVLMNSIIGIQMKNKITIPFIILLLCLQSCKKREAKLPEIETIPVTVTTIDTTGIVL
jgi:ABC-type methionine transport system permease subunit